MCGIAGYISNEEVIDPRLSIALPLLGVFMTDRGRQAWGWSNGTDIKKSLGEVRSTLGPQHLGHRQAIIHTRHATFGSNIAENAHPFAIKGIIGVHNGMIHNHKVAAEAHGIKYAVDSEVIYHYIADGHDLSGLEGYGAVAFWQDGVFNIGRFNNGDMALVKTEFGWVFASTDKGLADALGMSGLEHRVQAQMELEEGALYQLIGPDMIRSELKLNISKSVSKVTWQTARGPYPIWNPQTKKMELPTITSSALPFPTAATTTFAPLSDEDAEWQEDLETQARAMSAMSRAFDRQQDDAQDEHDAMWQSYLNENDDSCSWCNADIVGRAVWNGEEFICRDCYDDLEAYENADEYAEDTVSDMPLITNSFDVATSTESDWKDGPECADCAGFFFKGEAYLAHRTVPDFNLCGDCHSNRYAPKVLNPTSLDLALVN